MKYHVIEPEVIVGLGGNTLMDITVHPPFVRSLDIDLEDWLGDDLMEIFPCYIATEMLAEGLKKTDFSGFEIKNLTLSEAEYFQNNYQLQRELPKFYWLNITGKVNTDDFYINDNLKLSVSDKALHYLKNNFVLRYADIDVNNKFDDLFVGL